MTADYLPEQERALAYARKRGTDAPLSDIRSRVSATYAELEALVASIPPEAVQEHRVGSGWCVQEVVDHLVQSDRPAAGQLAQLLEGHDVLEPIPASLQSPAPHDLEWHSLLQHFGAVHRMVLDALGRASDSTPQTAAAAVQMVVKCAAADGTLQPVSWVHFFDWKAFAILLHAHNREHIAQIHRILTSPIERHRIAQRGSILKTVLFICEHGSAKSVVAAAHFNNLAAERGINLRAISRGTDPDAENHPAAVAGLETDGLQAQAAQPRMLAQTELDLAFRVVTFNELPTPYTVPPDAAIWTVPPVSEDYETSRRSIVQRIEILLADLS